MRLFHLNLYNKNKKYLSWVSLLKIQLKTNLKTTYSLSITMSSTLANHLLGDEFSILD